MSSGQRGGIFVRVAALLAFCALLGATYLVRHPLLQLAGNFWVVQDPLEHADAILILSDDNFNGDRATRAAELLRAGWAPVVVASGRMLRPYVGISEFMERDLESHGVPAAAIQRFSHNAANTREEAQALLGLVIERRWRRVLLVTSNYHTRRARYIFRKLFPPTIDVAVIPARDTDFDPDAWWKTRQGVKIFFLESVGYCMAMWEMRHRPIASPPISIPAESLSRSSS